MKKTVTELNPNKEYNLSELVKLSVFKVKSYHACKNIVMHDLMGDNILKARITGEGRGRSITLKGANVLKYLEANA